MLLLFFPGDKVPWQYMVFIKPGADFYMRYGMVAV